MPKVSAIIPTYNRADLLPRAIESVLGQTLRDLELIVVDDGSTDNTREIVERFAQRDNRIIYLWRQNSGGPAAPRNSGIERATGKYVAFLDHDDEWMPSKLEEQVRLFEASPPEIGFVACDYLIIIGTGGNSISKYRLPAPEGGSLFRTLLENDFIRTATVVMVRKDVFENVGGFDVSLPCGEDTEMWLRIAERYQFASVTNFLAKHYHHRMNTTLRTPRIALAESMEAILRTHRSMCERYPGAYSLRLGQVAASYCAAGELKKGRGYYLQSIRFNASNLKSWLSLITSYVFGRIPFRVVAKSKGWLRHFLAFK
jgi:glycosyltransferase involved in cell wall biosynthesis